jgi:hypothetical protein
MVIGIHTEESRNAVRIIEFITTIGIGANIVTVIGNRRRHSNCYKHNNGYPCSCNRRTIIGIATVIKIITTIGIITRIVISKVIGSVTIAIAV